MAKHVILEGYSFSPSTKTVTINGKFIRREQLLLITNVTTGTVIYNFSDPSLLATTYTNSTSTTTGLETTTVILNYNTLSMSSTDKLSILVEETYHEITPSEVLRDPVDKLRVSEPQSLIDTDFEYGIQPTKWESISLCSNRPSAFYEPSAPIAGITNITASGKTVTVSLPATAGITVGAPIFITGTLDTQYADGWWVVDSVSTNTSFTFLVNTAPAAALWDATKTYAFVGTFYTGAGITTTSIATASSTTVTVTTTGAHGLRVGNAIHIVGTTGVSGGPINGSWIVATTPTNNTFTFITNASASGTITLAAGASLTLFVRTPGYVEHRAFDGGVQFSNEVPYHGMQGVRQTRRYFRYQSGKGIQFSTGSILKPPVYLDNLTSSGTTVTVTTRYPHGFLPGTIIRVQNAAPAEYNGTFTVATAATPTTLTYTAVSAPATSPATGFPNIILSPFSWFGSSNRVGMFDSQNGFFFEFDGQQLYAVRRSSTTQLAGRVAVTAASQAVTGTNTKFSQELTPGDFIVIRGMSYQVLSIQSDTALIISPGYRAAAAASNCIVSKTVDTRFAQSEWNIDKCDGTGASGFNIDLTRMQMFYADYTWYGAGAIRFGFKNTRGEVVYCHRIVNNNVNTEAYMRSGNLPARYETNTIPPGTLLTSSLGTGGSGTVIDVANTSLFPSNGTLVITSAANTTAPVEYITYSAKSNTSFTISARGQTGGNTSAQSFTYSATAPIRVELYSPQCASTISHWGSSVIMDGKYDDDKSLVFNTGMNTSLTNLAIGSRLALISIRLAPTVDSGLTGVLGAREIINRMQLTLRSMGAFSTGSFFRIELILNGRVSAGTYVAAGGSSLAQVVLHTSGTTISGGESVYSFFTDLNNATSQDLTLVRDLANSILGGGTVLTAPTTTNNVYPDGPDTITLCATAVSNNTNTINARINWTEAQA
jgi:hypothetical protein